MEKENRDPCRLQLPIIAGIRIRQPTHDRLDQKRIPAALGQKLSQQPSLGLYPVVREHDLRAVARFGKPAHHHLQQSRKNIAVRIGADDRHGLRKWLCAPGPVLNIRPAALHPAHNPGRLKL